MLWSLCKTIKSLSLYWGFVWNKFAILTSHAYRTIFQRRPWWISDSQSASKTSFCENTIAYVLWVFRHIDVFCGQSTNFHRLWKGYITLLSSRLTLPHIVITRKCLSVTYKANTLVSRIVWTSVSRCQLLPHCRLTARRWRRKRRKWLEVAGQTGGNLAKNIS